MRHKLVIAAGLVGLTGLTGGAYYVRHAEASPEITTAPITRGSIVSVVAATATVEPVTTVQVGTQVSGSIQTLHADFNSIVRKGEVLARLDPSLYQSAIDQARANLGRTEADLERLKIAVADANAKFARAQELFSRQLIPATDLDDARVNRQDAEAQVRSAAAQVTQARAALDQAEVNLAKTVITSPIDGIVIARDVDVGQTVAASLQAPTLFVLAADLSQMQLKANIDESDVAQILKGQSVSFTVDAYPTRRFAGTVEQVRLNPIVDQNVVTYATIINAPNPDLELKPGMTASVTIEVARRDDVLRVPNAAIRFKPSAEVLRALGEESGIGAQRNSIWIYGSGRLQPIRVVLGAADATQTELVDGAVSEGTAVVTGASMPGAVVAPRAPASSPLMPSGPPRR